MIIRREGHLHLAVLSDFLADQLILKARDKAAGTDRKRLVFSLSAGKGLSIHKSLIVQVDHIVLLHRSIRNIHHPRIVVALFLDLGIYIFILYFRFRFGYFNSLVFAQSDRRLESHLGREDKGFALFNLFDRKLRIGNNLLLALLHRLRIFFIDHFIGGIIVENALPVNLFDDSARRLPLTETGYIDSAFIFQISLIDRLFQCLFGYFDGQLCHPFIQLFNFNAHSLTFLLFVRIRTIISQLILCYKCQKQNSVTQHSDPGSTESPFRS